MYVGTTALSLNAHVCLDSRQSIHHGDICVDIEVAQSKPRILYDMELPPFDLEASVPY